MALETKVFDTLRGTTTITDYASTRVYPVRMPPKVAAFPALVYTRVSSERVYTLSGFDKTEKATVQIDILANSYDSAMSLARSVASAMETSAQFEMCYLANQQDQYEHDFELYRVIQDFTVWHTTS